MVRGLIVKDLRRAWRNPLPWLMNLALPLCVTALIGLVFGGRSEGAEPLAHFKFGIVIEDDAALQQVFRGIMSRDKNGPKLLARGEAMKDLKDGRLSAIASFPPEFTAHFLEGRQAGIELVKEPSRTIPPAALEAFLGTLATALNVLAGRQAVPAVEISGGSRLNLFGFLLAGMTAIFLMMLANQGMADLHRELDRRTFERYHTVRERLLPFIASKAMFTAVIVVVGAVILLAGGGMIFHIHWPRPFRLAAVTLAYIAFATALAGALTALAPNIRYADVLNNAAVMLLAIAGGCFFPPSQLPALLRDYITPCLPTYWYSTAVRGLGEASGAWGRVTAELLGLAVVLTGVTSFLFRRRFRKGLHG